MFITKKRVVQAAVSMRLANPSVSPKEDERMFYYALGVERTLNELCARLGIDLVEEVRKDRERRYRDGT